MFSVSITNIASNTATANVLVPILADLAVTMCINPIYLTLPAGIFVIMMIRHCVFQFHIHHHLHHHHHHHPTPSSPRSSSPGIVCSSTLILCRPHHDDFDDHDDHDDDQALCVPTPLLSRSPLLQMQLCSATAV